MLDDKLNWLYLDLNSYFASVEQQLTPKLRGQPIAVVPVLSDSSCAIAASREAKSYGIKTGMLIYEARKLCPNLICVKAKHQLYVEYHHKILAAIDKHTPIDVIGSIDEVASKLTGSWQHESKIISIAKNIKKCIKEEVGDYIKCSIGIAQNKFLAKVASNLQKNDGLEVLYTKDMPNKISRMLPNDLPGIGRGMDKRLKRLGVITIDDLWNIPAKNLRRIFGSNAGETFWYMLHGYEVKDRETTRRMVSHSHVLGPEFREALQAKAIAIRLLLKATSRLRRLGCLSTELIFTYRIENSYKVKASTKFAPISDNNSIIKSFSKLWDELYILYKPTRIKKVFVALTGLEPREKKQLNLFDEHEESSLNKSDNLSMVVDQLNAKFGRDTIVQGAMPDKVKKISEQKIAFNRIPDIDEFFD